MTQLEEKFAQIVEDIHSINVSLTKHEILQEQYMDKLDQHMVHEERQYELFHSYYKKNEDFKHNILKELMPIKRYMTMIKGALWILGALGSIWVIIYQILDLMKD